MEDQELGEDREDMSPTRGWRGFCRFDFVETVPPINMEPVDIVYLFLLISGLYNATRVLYIV